MKPTPGTFFPVVRMVLFAAVGVAAGYLMVTSTSDSQARTPRGVSGRDFANLVACCEANDETIVELLVTLETLEQECLSSACTTGFIGDCCSDNGSPCCADQQCTELVCSQDSFCCDTTWDGICAQDAQDQCAVCMGGA